ncbi:MAG: response regulator [Nitrospiraceae bacterium]|jgi:two-component system, cell cycle sensor histidine kinase and response regulator CckA|nr:MAG: response regulator [Nitrospiraceae bacterium]
MPEKILVIDDEPLILVAVERALSRVGYTVTPVDNVKDLDSALSNAPFDLLITDINLGEESVDSIVQKVKESSPAIRVIYMSGIVNEGRCKDFIEKPFKIDDLRKKVRDMLHGPS